ncbi:MAG TPA: hypothetical protein VF753_00220 [Terriglobales bacterium]
MCILLPIFCAEGAWGQGLAVATPTGTAQTRPPSGLRITANVKTNFSGTNFGQVGCDANGDVYVRNYDASPKFMRAAVQRIGADGATSGHFGIADASLDGVINDFFVTARGPVYLLAWAQDIIRPGYHSYVLKFAPDGSLESMVRLQASDHVLPAHIAVFESGEILMTGRDRYTPFTAVFTSGGGAVKEIFEPEDAELGKRAQAGDTDVLAYSNVGNDAVDLGSAALGSDGNAYLMRRTSPALVYVISSNGAVVRKLYVGADGSSAFPKQIHAFPGGLALSFESEGGARALKVVSLEGKSLASYSVNAASFGDLACYLPPRFLFLAGANGDSGFEYRIWAEPK